MAQWRHPVIFLTIVAIASAVLEKPLQLTSAQPTCGSQANFTVCPSNQCCSQYGYCSTLPPFCGAGCQSGACSASQAAPAGITIAHVLFDYIGFNGTDTTIDEYTVNTSTTNTYILGLAFAIDMDNTGATQNGNYQVHWKSDLTPAAAKSWRERYPNVRISIALGGSVLYDSQGVQHPVNWYDPPNPTQWLANAVSSLTSIVQTYGADGIDIHIERFPNGSANFVNLIGSLVTTLRQNGVIKFATIAPGKEMVDLYNDLYYNNSNSFDILNFQDLDTVIKFLARCTSANHMGRLDDIIGHSQYVIQKS